jgi:hypothetical protein
LRRNKSQQSATAVGCLPLDLESIGFAIPILVRPTVSRLFTVQEVDEVSGRVCGFRILEPQDSQFIHVQGPSIGIGDEPLYAFFSSANDVSIGTLAILRPILVGFAEANQSRIALKLQINELIGTDNEKKVARSQMRQVLLDVQDTAAARSFYEGSVLRSVLWNRLLSVASSKEMSKRILQVRGRLSASVNQDGQISLDLSALSEEDQEAIDYTKLVSAILLEFEPQPATTRRPAKAGESGVHDAAAIQRQVEDLLSLVQQTGRQEERVALLMAAVLRNPTVGKTALLQYRGDRAKMATWAIAELRKAFIDTNWPSDERVIAALVPRLFTKQFPMARGDLLFFLAKHLGKWPQVNGAIREALQRTHSMFVNFWRKEIEEALASPETASPSS